MDHRFHLENNDNDERHLLSQWTLHYTLSYASYLVPTILFSVTRRENLVNISTGPTRIPFNLEIAVLMFLDRF